MSSHLDALRLAAEALQPYENAVMLWLRVAGVVWISVEALAAVVVWRAYFALRRALERHDA